MQQYKHRNFYTHEIVSNLELLYSYDTLVGVRYFDKVFFTTKKYSSTTSKQQTMYTNENKLKRYNVEQQVIDKIHNWYFGRNYHNIIDELNFQAI